MKKTLHGKRYMMSRSTVRIGRENRKYKKLMRGMNFISKAIGAVDFVGVFDAINKALLEMNEALKKISHPSIEEFKSDIIMCEMCTNRAEYFVRDTKWFNDRALGSVTHEPDGDVHAFCTTHYRDSQSTYGGDINITS